MGYNIRNIKSDNYLINCIFYVYEVYYEGYHPSRRIWNPPISINKSYIKTVITNL